MNTIEHVEEVKMIMMNGTVRLSKNLIDKQEDVKLQIVIAILCPISYPNSGRIINEIVMERKNIIKRIISSPYVQTFLVYVSGGWIFLELSDYIISKYGLNTGFSDILPIILLIGLPFAMLFTWFLSRDKNEDDKKETEKTIPKKSERILQNFRKKLWFYIPGALVILLLIFTGIRYLHRQTKIRWAKQEALSQMRTWLGDRDQVNAFNIRQEIVKYIPDDPEFIELDQLATIEFSVITEPEGADVYYKEYSHVNDEWIKLGTTPLTHIELPNRMFYRWKIEKQGFEVVYAAGPTHMDTLFRTLHREGTIPEGMVYVEGVYPQTVEDFLSQEKNGFYIDKYEVTNQMYKEFMDQGGYSNPDFWQNEFILDDDTLFFDEAMNYFKDITNRPGPATWEAGDYPDGQDNYPVNGISWYEAAAYAVYAGKNLTTLLHWRSAAGFLFSEYPQLYGSHVVPLSNILGSGPEPVGRHQGISYFGTYDMAGNVREWCWNESTSGKIILGGAWSDISYMSTNPSQMPAFNRSSKNGFRCAKYLDRDSVTQQAFQPISVESDSSNLNDETPVSEAGFQYYQTQFLYDKTDLQSLIEERDENQEDWIIERISFDAAYENERMIAYLFLPKNSNPPFQTIVFFPGSYARVEDNLLETINTNWRIDYLLKNGRAVIFPVYKGTYDRRKGICEGPIPSESHLNAECLVKQVKDLSRSIDYLETRDDIDIDKLGFLGESWGGWMGNIIPAVEERIKLSVLVLGGIEHRVTLPEVDPYNYVSHVKSPVLMLNGKYDLLYTYESHVKPMYDHLGTPEQHKKLMLYETDHFVPKSEIIKETLAWLDRYFGTVD